MILIMVQGKLNPETNKQIKKETKNLTNLKRLLPITRAQKLIKKITKDKITIIN